MLVMQAPGAALFAYFQVRDCRALGLSELSCSSCEAVPQKTGVTTWLPAAAVAMQEVRNSARLSGLSQSLMPVFCARDCSLCCCSCASSTGCAIGVRSGTSHRGRSASARTSRSIARTRSACCRVSSQAARLNRCSRRLCHSDRSPTRPRRLRRAQTARMAHMTSSSLSQLSCHGVVNVVCLGSHLLSTRFCCPFVLHCL